jgi:hypothetical protein
MQSSDPNEWSKKPACWNDLQPKIANVEKFSERIIATDTEDTTDSLSKSDQEIITKAEAYSSQFWFTLASWAKTNNFLAVVDRKAALNYGSIRSKGKGFSLKQAKNALKIVDSAIGMGFKE